MQAEDQMNERTAAQRRATNWTWTEVLLFEAIVCGVSLLFDVTGALAKQIVVTVPKNGISVGSNTLLLLGASLVPGLILLVISADCRAAVLRFKASPWIYILALLTGLALPFTSYIGTAHVYPVPWSSGAGLTLARVFFINLLLSPLWEEVIWRAYFYQKIGTMLKPRHAVLVTSAAWTIWHVGFVFLLFYFGVAPRILCVFVIQTFLVGIILCSLFTLAHNSLAPCVLLHTALNASTTVYYGRSGRVSDIGSYIAEAIVMAVVAFALFRAAMQRASGNRTITFQ
jgi:membrane protease YdiL (CAAX protease family)